MAVHYAFFFFWVVGLNVLVRGIVGFGVVLQGGRRSENWWFKWESVFRCVDAPGFVFDVMVGGGCCGARGGLSLF